MEHVPRAQSEMGLDHEREARAKEDQTDIEIDESLSKHTFRVRHPAHQLRLRFLESSVS